jgi:hypothetical protein
MIIFGKLGISLLIIVVALMLMYSVQWAFSWGSRIQALTTWGIGIAALMALVLSWVSEPPLWIFLAILVVAVGLFFVLGGGL